MSANGHAACPACYAREHDKDLAEVTWQDLLEVENEEALAEYYEISIDRGRVVVKYGAECEDCDYGFNDFEFSHPLPEAEGL